MVSLFHDNQVGWWLDTIDPCSHGIDVDQLILIPLDDEPGALRMVQAIEGITVGRGGNADQLSDIFFTAPLSL